MTLIIPAPCRWLTANDRRIPIAKGRDIRAWRIAAFERAQAARLPQGLVLVRIEPVAFVRGRSPVRDAANLEPTVKAAVDGLGPDRRTSRTPNAVGWGLVPDDDDAHVRQQPIRIERLPAHPYLPDQLALTITDLIGGTL